MILSTVPMASRGRETFLIARRPSLFAGDVLSEGCAHRFQTLRNRSGGGFLALHLKGHIAVKVRLAENAGDAFVVEIQSIVFTASEIGLKVNDGRAGSELFDFGIGIAGKVSDVEIDAEPWGVHSIDDAEKILRLERDAPVILDHEHDAGLFGGGDASADRFNAPIDGVLFCIAGDGRFVAFHFHEVVEEADGAPAAGVDTDRGAAELAGHFDAVLGMADGLTAFIGPGRNKILMDGKHGESHAAKEGRAFQAVEVFGRFIGHLAVQDFDAREAQARGIVDDFFDGIALVLEMPVGVTGDGKARRERRRSGLGGSGCGRECGGCREETTSIKERAHETIIVQLARSDGFSEQGCQLLVVDQELESDRARRTASTCSASCEEYLLVYRPDLRPPAAGDPLSPR
jgi:hypothetical protein